MSLGRSLELGPSERHAVKVTREKVIEVMGEMELEALTKRWRNGFKID